MPALMTTITCTRCGPPRAPGQIVRHEHGPVSYRVKDAPSPPPSSPPLPLSVHPDDIIQPPARALSQQWAVLLLLPRSYACELIGWHKLSAGLPSP